MKPIRFYITALLIVLSALLLFGCGADKPEGKWRVVDFSAPNNSDSKFAMQFDITFDFQEYDVLIFGVSLGEMNETEQGKWTCEDDIITIDIEGLPAYYEYTLDGDKLTLIEHGANVPSILHLERCE